MKIKTGIRVFLRWAIPVIIFANVVLLLLGLLLYPTVIKEDGLSGISAGFIILLTYGFLALFSPISVEKVSPALLKLAGALGLLGGLALAIDLVAAYLTEPNAASSSVSSLVAYGLFLALLFMAAIFAANMNGRVNSGIAAAVWGCLIALLLWFFVEFATFYLFAHTPNGAKFIQLEMQTDFERSKSTDFQGFVMGDFYGAGFFHLLLGLCLALILGATGGLLGKLFHREKS